MSINLEATYCKAYPLIQGLVYRRIRRMLSGSRKDETATGDESELSRRYRRSSRQLVNDSDVDELADEALSLTWELWLKYRPTSEDLRGEEGEITTTACHSCANTVARLATYRAMNAKSRLVGPMKPTKGVSVAQHDVSADIVSLLPAEIRPLFEQVAHGEKLKDIAAGEGVTYRALKYRIDAAREFVKGLFSNDDDAAEFDRIVTAKIGVVAGRMRLRETNAPPLPIEPESEPETHTSEPVAVESIPCDRSWFVDRQSSLDDIRTIFAHSGRRFAVAQ